MPSVPSLAALVLALVLPGACATSHPASRPAGNPTIARIENGLRPQVLFESDATWSIAERMLEYGVPGLSIAVFRDGRLDWARAWGSADLEEHMAVTPETLFQAGSISKGVAAMGALVLVERGRLALDADINAVLTSWKVPANEHTAKAPVTLEGLLSHTAGLTVHGFPGYEAGTPVPTLVQILDAAPPVNTPPVRVDLDPGTKHRYSGGGYTVAQLAMTDVTGQAFPQLMQELVLGPLGMTASTYEQPLPAARVMQAAAGYRADGVPVPGKRSVYPEMMAAGLWTTPSDIARFAIGVQDMQRGEPGPISTASVRDMLTPRLDGYALGLKIDGDYFTHGGADDGFRAYLYAHKTKGYGIALMTNSDTGMPLMQEIVRAVGAAYAWDDFETDPVKIAQLSPEALAACAGRFAFDSGAALELSVHGSGLRGVLALVPPFEFFPVSANEFLCREEELRLVFRDGVLTFNEYGASRVLPRLTDGAQFPDDDLEAGRLDAAVAGYRRLREADPADESISEERMLESGDTLLDRKEVGAALAVLRLNAEFRPESARAYDSLAIATEAAGDRSGAIALYRKTIELASPEAVFWLKRNERARTHATERLQSLGAAP